MLHWRLPLAVGVWSMCVCLACTYEDDIEVNYADTYYNEITEEETPEPTLSAAPCNSPDLTKWDKIFSMLENSQMRENMLLQYADDIVKVEMGSLRGEILRFVAQYGGSCGIAVETAGRRMALQLEAKLRESLVRLKSGDHTAGPVEGNSVGNSNNLEALLQQLLSATRTQATRLAKMETSCFSNPGAVKAAPENQDVGGEGHRDGTLEGILAVLRQTKTELQEVLRSLRPRHLPAGCEMALLFPMRSCRIYTSVIPDVPLSLSSFTVCLWVKPVAVSNKTVLFSYGDRHNPCEIQLLLSHTSALLTIGGETHLVEARRVIQPDGPPEWLHLCGAWSSEQGLASLWVGGKKVASTPGVAEGHILPDGGSLQLGQERNSCCHLTPSSGGNGMAGFEAGFDPKLAFAGTMTGVNMWDKVLPEEKISQLALQDGQGCEHRGNIVMWGLTEMVPHGGAQFVN